MASRSFHNSVQMAILGIHLNRMCKKATEDDSTEIGLEVR